MKLKMMKEISIAFVIIVIIFAIIGSFIKTMPVAPPNARIIVDHSLKVYVAPPCFNDAEVTNFLEETTYERALELGYEPESSCTEQAVTDKPRSLFVHVLEVTGWKKTKWTKDGEWNY